MAHYVFQTDDGFISTRKATGRYAYTARVTISDDLEGARIFNTKSAASNAATHGGFEGSVREVILSLKED